MEDFQRINSLPDSHRGRKLWPPGMASLITKKRGGVEVQLDFYML